MAPYVHRVFSQEEYLVILEHFMDKVKRRYAVFGYTEDFVNKVMEMAKDDGDVPRLEEWTTNFLREKREEKEAQEREAKVTQEQLLRLKAENDLLKQQMRDVYCVHGNVDNEDPLLNWLIKPWVYRLEKALKKCHNHPEVAQVFSELINSGSASRADVLSEEFLKACIPHLINYNYPVTVQKLKEGVRKIIKLS